MPSLSFPVVRESEFLVAIQNLNSIDALTLAWGVGVRPLMRVFLCLINFIEQVGLIRKTLVLPPYSRPFYLSILCLTYTRRY